MQLGSEIRLEVSLSAAGIDEDIALDKMKAIVKNRRHR